jgi:hypothetical protein
MVCSYNRREANGPDGGVTPATQKSRSPLQAIEKKQLRNVRNLTLARPFVDGQWFGRNRKLLGNCPAYWARAAEHFSGLGSI